MKLLSYVHNGTAGYGALKEPGLLVDLTRRLHGVSGLRDLLEQGRLAEAAKIVEKSDATVAFDSVRLLPVIPNPSKIICIGINYVAHAREAGRKVGDYPVVFHRFAESLAAHNEPLLCPVAAEQFDYEGELAVIIGRGGSHIDREDAMRHVAGYSCFNDASARDWQFHTHQYGMGKNFRRTGAFGPWMVTADEIEDYREIELRTELNGEVMQEGKLDQLAFDVPAIISYVSKAMPWVPGDVISTGTPSGVGFKREPPVLLKPGDSIDIHVSQVGVLHNGVELERIEKLR
jgi:2-keto-4-pentenoate hydratase/2-oxohepta-3-ene-1,7-dioic acid hydratase in catechol pathway